MPLEHRQITFTVEEITRAVAELMSHHGVLPANSKVVAVRVTEDDGKVSGLLSLLMPGSDKLRDLPLTSDLLGAALIRLCRQARIPLPRTSRKRLVRVGESLAMHLNFDAAEAMISPRAPVDKETATPAATRPKNNVFDNDPSVPDWWSNMSRRR